MRNIGIFIIIIGLGIIILTIFPSYKAFNVDQVAFIKNSTHNFNWYLLVGPIVLWIGALILGRSYSKKHRINRHFIPRHYGKYYPWV
jgi:hypothetical protein